MDRQTKKYKIATVANLSNYGNSSKNLHDDDEWFMNLRPK